MAVLWFCLQTSEPNLPVSAKAVPRVSNIHTGNLTSATSIQVEPLPGQHESSVASNTTRSAHEERARDQINNERILSFYSTAELNQFLQNAEAMGLEVLDHMEFGTSVRIRVSDPSLLDAVLLVSPRPTRTEYNYSVATPDPSKGSTFTQGQFIGFGEGVLPWLGVPTEHQEWGKQVTIAILDGPTDSEHARAVRSLIDGEEGPVPGIAPGADILSMAVLSDDGSGDTYTLAKAILSAVANGADVINLSVGSYGDSSVLREAVAYAIEQGVVLVAAVGNDSLNEICYPARYDGVVAVTAVDAAGQRMDFANSGSGTDIAAPGLAILVASTNVTGTSLMSGTSMATPLVSGAIAALASIEDISPTNAAALLMNYANDEGQAGEDSDFGNGILNIQRALNRELDGIYDVAIGTPWLTQDSTGLNLHVYIENRGTEVLQHVTVAINAAGLPMTAHFHDISPATTAQQTLTLASLSMDDPVAIVLTATIDGHDDQFPSDNQRQGSITQP